MPNLLLLNFHSVPISKDFCLSGLGVDPGNGFIGSVELTPPPPKMIELFGEI